MENENKLGIEDRLSMFFIRRQCVSSSNFFMDSWQIAQRWQLSEGETNLFRAFFSARIARKLNQFGRDLGSPISEFLFRTDSSWQDHVQALEHNDILHKRVELEFKAESARVAREMQERGDSLIRGFRIQNAANVLSSTFLEMEQRPPEEALLLNQQTIDRITMNLV